MGSKNAAISDCIRYLFWVNCDVIAIKYLPPPVGGGKYLFQFSIEVVNSLAEQVVTGIATEDTVVAVCIDQLAEVLVSLHQRLDILR